MIIRRNSDGSIIEEQATQSHPALATKRGMSSPVGYAGQSSSAIV